MPEVSATVSKAKAAGKTALTSFIGRRSQLAEAKARMMESRLVTLTGPGGVGKTRLALEVAERSRKAFRDGVWLVELDGLRDENRVASFIAGTLSLPDQSTREATERMIDYLRDREVLLLLDNCEHVLQGAAEVVGRLLTSAPGVRVLATSREPLGIAGEHICLIPPLSTPPTDGPSPGGGDLMHFESVALFVDRARSIVADFEITDENREAVAQLCIRLDGMPLSIELAATRLRSLSVTGLLERLDERFQLLTRGDRAALPRQQTLQALIDWSHELCTPAEQLLWRRLSVFPESFDLDAAEYVCGFGGLEPRDVLDLLDRLVAQSILFIQRSGEDVRYHQLMTIREYGTRLLVDAAERDELRHRHRDHYLNMTESIIGRWCGPDQARFLAATRTERPNLMAALEWSIVTAGEVSAGARLASALRYHWIAGGVLSDGRAWLDRILQVEGPPTPERGSALWVAGWVCLIQGDHQAASEHLEECRNLATELGDPVLRAHALHGTALHHLFTGDLPASISLYREVIDAHEQSGDPGSQLIALFQLAMAQAFSGECGEAMQTCRDSMATARAHGEQWTLAYSLWVTAICHWSLKENAAAKKAAREALRIQDNFRDGICTSLTIELLSWVAVSTGDFARAWELGRAAESVWRGLGTTIAAFGPHITEAYEDSQKRIRNALDSGIRDIDTTIGPGLTKEQAIALALGSPTSRKVAEPNATRSNPLTKRELEIAELVAQGLTNRLIAQKLVVSPRTVDGHVERILAKLDFTSRVQVVSWLEGIRSTV